MANNYNGARRIPVVFADGGGARLAVRRERTLGFTRSPGGLSPWAG